MEKIKERNIITDKLVVEKTNRTLEEWYTVLDEKGATKMKHNKIFELVSNTPKLKSLNQWNQNLLATSYEWSRGIKKRGERNGSFEISVSKIISVNVSFLYQAWIEDHQRNKWLKNENVLIRKATENKSARITWSDNITSLSVDFYKKGDNKSQVAVQHMKIDSLIKADQLKEYWNNTLLKLKDLLKK